MQSLSLICSVTVVLTNIHQTDSGIQVSIARFHLLSVSTDTTVDTRVDRCQRQSLAHNEGKISLSRLVVLVETSQILPSVLFFFATAYCIQFLTKQDPFVIDVNHTRVQEGSTVRISFANMGNLSFTVFDPVLFTVQFVVVVVVSYSH